MAEQSTVQSLDRAFDLLETLCRSRNGMQHRRPVCGNRPAQKHGSPSLTSMCARGYVQRDAETSVYRAGMRLCEMSSYIVDNLDIVERARASLERLEQCTDETVHLVMRDDKDIVYIHKVDNGSSAIRMFSRIGMRLPLYCTGVGKAILATWDTAEVRDVWQHSDVHAWTEHTIVDEDAFFREIDKVRQLGYALDNEENELGVRCIAAAIPGLPRTRVLRDFAVCAGQPHDRPARGRAGVRRSWLRGTKSRARLAAAAFEEGRA